MTQTKALAVKENGSLEKNIYESLALKGDISGLSPQDKALYMQKLCESVGLNPLTQPFIPLKLNGKEVLYASRTATDQLAGINKLTREIIKTEMIQDVYVATCKVSSLDGRFDISTGAVTLGNLRGDALANALMKAETKAKRRATLSFCGLGFLDESEIETISPSRIERMPSTDAPRLQTKGELIEKSKQASESKETPIQAVSVDVVDAEFIPQESKLSEVVEEIKTLLKLVGMNPTLTVSKIASNPEKADLALHAVHKTVITKVLVTENGWDEVSLETYFKPFGFAVLAEANLDQTKAVIADLRKNKML